MKDIFKLLEDNFHKSGNPLGVRISPSWAAELGIDYGGKRILFTGLSYQLMPFTISALNILEKGKAVSILGKLSKLGLSRLIPKKETDSFYNALRAAYKLLKQSGIDFGFLYEKEPYDGALFYDFGMDWLVDENEARIKKIFEENNVKEVLTISPHSYFMLKNVYDLDIEVRHILELVDLPRVNRILHEPCILARKTDFAEKFREKFQKLAILPKRSGKLTSCCGGPVELIYPELSRAICINRAKELEEEAEIRNVKGKITESTVGFITACPICLMNFLRCGFEVEDYLTVSVREGKFAGGS
ncbi:MAG: (Fe-S)-binding protein [Archaeoglobus sp.]|nr:(Fe-S)-binding protein [Archaeoglobus sp.]